MTGVNLLYETAGMHASLLGFCLESLLIDNDMLGSINRNVRGIEVNDETLSVEVIRDVCLERPRPLSRPRPDAVADAEGIYLSRRRQPHEPQGMERGGQARHRRACEARKREILSTHYPDYLPRAIDERIRAKHDIKLPREVMEPGDPRWTRI